MTQHRLNLVIQPEHAKRLDELAAKKGVSKSSIVAAALASWPARISPWTTVPLWMTTPGTPHAVSSTRNSPVSVRISPGSPIWPPPRG